MFPIPWNFPFRKKNGDLSTIGDVIGGGGGGSDLPPHSASDAGKLLGVKLDGSLEWSDEVNSEIQTLTQNLDNEIATRVQLGAHQLLDYDLAKLKALNTEGTWTNNSYLTHGVTFVVNSDLSITFSGISDTSSNPLFNIVGAMVLDKDVIMSEGIGADTYDYYLQATSSGSSWNTKGQTPTIPSGTSLTSVRIRCAANRTISSTTFKPLFKLANDPSNEFTPYAMTNRELTEVKTAVSTNGNLSFIKVGRVVLCKLHANNVTLASGESVGNIPDGFVPLTDGLQMIETTQMKMFSISANNKNITTNNAYTNSNVRGTIMWLI